MPDLVNYYWACRKCVVERDWILLASREVLGNMAQVTAVVMAGIFVDFYLGAVELREEMFVKRDVGEVAHVATSPSGKDVRGGNEAKVHF